MPMRVKRFLISGPLAAIAICGAIATEFTPPNGRLQPLAAQAQGADEATNIRVYDRAAPAVVSIETRDSNGSGSIITSDGLVLTNAHVLGPHRTATVTLADGRRFIGDVVGFGSPGLDLAALRLRNANNLPIVTLAASDSVRVGQRAFAIGNPFGQFQGTFTTGIVSRLDPQKGLIQTDAAINPGNSGGPLLNSDGELIGVNTAIYAPSNSVGNIGIGFAIAINQVRPFLTAVQEGSAPQAAQQRDSPPSSRPVPRALALNGEPLAGTLTPNSGRLSDGSFFNTYQFTGQRGEQVVIEMLSREFDTYLILLGPDGSQLAQDDDSSGSTDARITITLPQSGPYTVIANSYRGGATGRYALQARSLRRPSPGNPPSAPNNALVRYEGILAPGAQVSRLPDGSLYKEYTFQGTAGQTVTLTLESTDFDTYLILLDARGQKLAENDDVRPGTTDSQLTLRLPRSETYRILVNAYDRRGQGRYRLTIR